VSASVSVIIPTLNDANRLPRLMRALAPERQGVEREILVCDGGSLDATRHLARTLGADRVIDCDARESARLRAGAAAASGAILLFLDPAMLFPEHGLATLTAAMQSDLEAVGGSFRIAFEGDPGLARTLTAFSRWQRRRRVYDFKSAVFVRRTIHDQLGGVPGVACLAGYAFVRALEARGRTLCLEQQVVGRETAPYAGHSRTAIVWRWLWRHGLYHLGVAPELIARIESNAPGGASGAGWRKSR